MITLAGFDLNLLVAFDALITERHLSRAAAKVGVTQPALSYALRRLRLLLNDDLFVRRRTGMQPTPVALELEAPVTNALRQVALALEAPSKFIPSTATRSFKLSMTDSSAITSLPRLTCYLRSHAKGIDLRVTGGGSSTSLAQLSSGEVDLAIGVFPRIMPGLKSRELYRDELVCVVDRNHKMLSAGKLSLKNYLTCPHIRVATDKDTGMEIDDILDGMGLKRRVMITIPHFSSVPELVRGSDLIGHVRRGFSTPGSPNLQDFCIFTPPLPRQVPPISFMQVWHEKNDNDRAHKWLRQVIATSCAAPGMF